MSAAVRGKPRVAVFSPNQGAPSETFIRAHIERLPLETVPIYGGRWQRSDTNGRLWPILRYPGWALGRVSPAVGDALYARALGRKLGQLGIDVALAEYGMTGVEIADACKCAQVPLVVHFHGYDTARKDVIKRYLRSYGRLFADASAIIAVSTPMKDKLIAWGAPKAKLHHAIYGVDQERFRGAAPAAAPAHFVAVGRFVDKKAPHLTVQAFREVAAADPTATLSMVGDGPLLEATRQQAAALGLDKRVAFLGVQDQAAIAALMRRARAFVQHSMTADDGDSEGTPVAIIEAQMTGLPVVSTRHAGIPEVVVEGETGFLVDEGDATSMGRMMARLALEPELAGDLGKRARVCALDRFTLDRYLGDVTRILEKAAARQ